MVGRTLAGAALGSLLLCAAALADRAGDAPIKAPRALTSDHIAFTLAGGGWRQAIGALDGLPMAGHYERVTTLANGGRCRLVARVSGKRADRRPYVMASGRGVKLLPGESHYVMIFDDTGRHGPVRWWAGTTFHAQSGGFQRLPKRLRTVYHHFLVYRVAVRHVAAAADDEACAARALNASLRIAQTMHLAAGPPVSASPYVTAQPLPPRGP